MSSSNRCRAKTKQGLRCKRLSVAGTAHCSQHAPSKSSVLGKKLIDPAIMGAISSLSSIGATAGTPGFGDQHGAVVDIQLDRLKALVRDGKTHIQEMQLACQATTLDVVFNSLLVKANANLNDGHLSTAEMLMKLALRAQAQSRLANETLLQAKHPRPVFVGQNNIANQQQINNGTEPGIQPRDEKSSTAKRSIDHEEIKRVDARTTTSSVGSNPKMETVGRKYRPSDA